ncbi:class I SAM-dependent methyltransferase [Oscillatoria sp. FACHB-1406]|uniref:class I SAM-dependent methyltransferase n=1 Tax=Oscillatoria sp. FACHB-1406 TaxID=2692846 RepID=UPI00168452B5|nr:class I SAM-dependent methyltransferase [Oscillatoria sp. FACHB-1406]MBD2579004.1 class I SAM-dependent methyltransferase [Oscillatoria sp. FACHB-1406]
MPQIVSALFKLPLLRELKPGWIDTARAIVQGAVFQEMTRAHLWQGKCLNAGCGEGLYCSFLSSFPDLSEIVNLDLETPQLYYSRVDDRHQEIKGSLTALPFAKETFDCCLCSEVIEHIEADELAVAELARVLKVGATLLLSVPTPPAPNDPAHVREGYTYEQLSSLLERQGFKIQCHAYCFYNPMRVLDTLWRWQYRVLGAEKRNYFPQFLVKGLGYCDRVLKVGKPWDLVVLARKESEII